MTPRLKTALSALTVAFVISGSITAWAQSAAQRPTMKVGDTWTWSLQYTGQRSSPDSRYTVMVTNMDAGQTTASWQNTVLGTNGTLLFDPNQNLVQVTRAPTFVDMRATPSRPNYQWPLFPGATWQNGYQYTAYNGGRQYQATLAARVAGLEKITVPAGTFDTYKITRRLEYHGFDGTSSWAGAQDETVWYAPQIKTFAKSEITDHGPRYAERTAVRELLSYNVK